MDESERLKVLADFGVMDTGPDDVLDEIVALASEICDVPIALVSLVDDSRQWFKARIGLEAQQTPRDVAFCAHVIAAEGNDLFTVPDASKDSRFRANPFVTGDPNVAFYAGAPLVVDGGAKLGTLCVIDRKPRQLTASQERALMTLSKVVARHLQQRRDDIERRELLAARLKAERETQRMFDLSAELICTTQGGRFTRVNPAFEQMLGWSAQELLGTPASALDHPDDTGNAARARGGLNQGDPLRAFESRFRHKDGSYRWISWNATHEGELTYAVGRDVTDEKALVDARARLLDEQREARKVAENASRAMDEFLATVSHELRTPLNAILGWTRLMRGDRMGEDQRVKALATIERNAVSQTQLINDLLDVSRIIAGKMRLDLVPVELVSVIEAALDVVRPAAEAKGVRLHALLDPSASHVTGDQSRLQQVVWNLVSNAVKFTPKGGRVEVALVRVASSVDIVVTDTGSGIDAEFVPHVFERFRQADGAMNRAHGGLGLGLAIVKNIAELHGGSVRVTSAGAGQGASFAVRLPLSNVRPESANRIVAEHPVVGVALPFDCPAEIDGLRILVVDDEEDARELMVATLRRCHADVVSAGSVAEALDVFQKGSFAVVLSDVGMPGEDGYALIKKIRRLPADRGGRVPVVALTAYARAEDRTRTLRAGFNAHVAKPIETSELLAVLASLVERKSDY